MSKITWETINIESEFTKKLTNDENWIWKRLIQMENAVFDDEGVTFHSGDPYDEGGDNGTV